ncbi:MAG TPA: hypothetical protein VGP57_21370 [Actinoplanes sp.]|jgi:hypothetical protein|nr:hypothetical protein [Actinoplanes sp.]
MDEPVRIIDRGEGTLELSLSGDIDFANPEDDTCLVAARPLAASP